MKISVLCLVSSFVGLAASAALPFFRLNTVTLPYGTYIASSDAQVNAFLGIPYAAPPVGDLRFRNPTPLPDRVGGYEASTFQPRCLQAVGGDLSETISEDCLYLNVWTPADVGPNEKLPVFVYVHGAFYPTQQRSSEPFNLDLSDVIRQSLKGDRVIAVSISYRSNIFGLFSPSLPDFQPAIDSNVGLSDVKFALSWVSTHISKFGGNPAQITAVGHGVGASLVSTLARTTGKAAPFTRLVLLSGGETTIPRVSAEQHQALLTAIITSQPNADECRRDPVACLKALPADRLLDSAITQAAALKVNFGLVTDNNLVTDIVKEDVLADSTNFAKIPVLVGQVALEGKGTTGVIDAEGLDYWLSVFVRSPATANLIKVQNEGLSPTEVADTASGLVSYTCPLVRSASLFRYTSSPVYRYVFNVDPRNQGEGGLYSQDLPFLFNQRANIIGTDANDVSNQLSNAFLSFVARGQPG
ncbi:hypothetical protein HDU96_007355, partial [Phlyctochytrium bullatum]